MKNEMSSVELRSIIGELQFLVGSRMDKIFQSSNSFYLNFYVRAKGNFMLRIVSGRYIYLTKHRPSTSEPDTFCLSLRKNLMNSALKGIEQLESERIVRFTFETKDRKFFLFAELFAKGNIILCNDKEVIISLLEKQKWKDRIVAVNRRYEYPKKELNVFEIKRSDIEMIKDSKAESTVKALARDLGIGGVYAEEVCILANIDKNIAPKKLADVDVNAVYKALKEILEKKPEPKIIIKDEKIVNIVPFDLEYYESCEFEKYKTYNDALDEVFTKEMVKGEEKEYSKAYLKKAEKINKIIEQQEKNLEEKRKIIEENQKKGEFIYEKYAFVKGILEELNKAKQKHSWQEIKQKLKGHKVIKSINEKEKKVVVEV